MAIYNLLYLKFKFTNMAFLYPQRISQDELSQVKAAVLDDPAVQDCVVLAREAETSGIELVVYVVSSFFSPEQLQSRLQTLLPEPLVPSTYVPVSTLPLTPSGQVDEQALARVEVIDSDLIRRWEEQLRSLPEIEQVAVVVQEHAESLPPLHLSDLLPTQTEIELWPSVAEYYVYDELLYHALTNDLRRNHSYKVAINQLVKDQIVVEIGTGQDAILARFCVEAGARKVYAIERDFETSQQAKACVQNLGFSDSINIIHGDATLVNLPELADVCVSELVGPIGGCEGAAVIINNARRFLKQDGTMIPERSITRIAATSLPESFLHNPKLTSGWEYYTQKIFEQIGYPFDLRVCIKNFPNSNLISNVEIFEDLNFTKPVNTAERHEVNFTISKEGRLDGFLVWLNLHTISGEVIDILEHEYSWLPVYFPVFEPGVEVSGGDTIQAFCTRELCENNLNPDYSIKGRLLRKNGEVIDFEYISYHHKKFFRQTPFYQRLFSENKVGNSRVKEIEASREQGAAQKVQAQKAIAISRGGLLPREDIPTTLPEVLQRSAKQALGDLIIYPQSDGEIIQSYAGLLEEAERILAGLRKLGLKPQNQVIFQLECNHDIISAFWGCLLGGFVPIIIGVPPSYRESNHGVDKICHVWELLDHPLILTTQALEESVKALSHWLSAGLKIGTIEAIKTNNPEQNYHPSKPDDLAFFNLTSGTTGVPKCIGLTHWNLISRALGTNLLCKHEREDVILNWLPFDHIGSISDWHIRCVLLGCKLIYVPKEHILERPLNWLDLIDKYRITHSWAPNFAYALINDVLVQKPEKKWNLDCVKSLVTAGEAVSSKAVEEFIEKMASYRLKQTVLRPAFGMAEMGSGITYYQPTEENPLKFHAVEKSFLNEAIKGIGTEHPNSTTFTDLGSVIPGVSIRIVDNENSLLPEYTIGRLQVQGDAVSPGYYRNPEANKEAFLEDGWFNTGDLGFIANGNLVLTGRAKETIIVNGANYYYHEIEAIVEEIEEVEVSYTAACAVKDARGATEKLAIFFNTSCSNDDWLIELSKKIRQTVVNKVGLNPAYLIPVEKEVIPKTAIGKIQRSQLAKRFEAGEFNHIIKRIVVKDTLPDWFYRKIWCQKQAPTLNLVPQTAPTLVFLDKLGLGTFLCGELNRLKQPCVSVEAGSEFAFLGLVSEAGGDRVQRFRINPNEPDHYVRLLESVATSNRIAQILHLWTYDEYTREVESVEALQQAQEQGSYSLLFLIQALAKVQGSEHSVRLQVISSHTQCTSPSDEIAYEKSPVLGMIKTITQEMPWLLCRHVDLPLDQADINGAYILRELGAVKGNPEVTYRNGQRLVPRLEKVNLLKSSAQELPFQRGGMYLLSGGLGGIGVEIAKYLLQHYDARLLLVGRTPLPERSEWEFHLEQADAVCERIKTYLALEQLGGKISYEAVDICDGAKLQQVVDQAQSRFSSRLDGVIHLAGVFQECLLAEETRESLLETLRAKVLGTWVLHQLIKDQPQAVFISSSSVNGFFGGAMVGAYAAANSFLDCFSQYQRCKHSLRSYCFSWSQWDGVGMNRGTLMKDLSRARGYQPITAEQGLHSLLVGLYHEQTHLFVGLDGGNRHIRQHTNTKSARVQKLSAYFTSQSDQVSLSRLQELVVPDRFGVPSICDFVPIAQMLLTEMGEIDREHLAIRDCGVRRATTERVLPQTALERRLAGIWKQVLGIKQLGIYDNFLELGGDSLRAMQIVSQLRVAFSLELPLRSFLLECSTIAKLALLIEEMLIEKLERLAD